MSQKVCCRTCLAEYGDLVPIFSDDCYVDDLPDKLLNTIRIEVQKDDELPKMICKKCIFLVDSLHCFKDQCEMAEMKLKESLKNSLPSFCNVGELISACEANAFSSELSSDEYPIIYASEEAKIEYENFKKMENENFKKHKKCEDKKKNTKCSGPKVKSVIQILPSESKEKSTYKNLPASSSVKHKNSAIKEDENLSDNDDDKSSSFLSDEEEESSRYSSNTYDKYQSDGIISGRRNNHDGKSLQKEFIKRKREHDDSFSHLSKMPKSIIVTNDNYDDDQDLHYKAVIKNQIVPSEESLQMEMVNDDVFNSVEKLTNCEKTHNASKTTMNSLPSIPPNEDFQTSHDNITVLERYATLNLPNICTICSSSFESPKEVLKHKLECHLKPDQSSYFCPICHENFPSNSNLVDHVNIHKDVLSLICILCSGCFYTEETLRKHLQESHINLHELKCNTCSQQFYKFQTLITHLKEHITPAHLTCMLCSKECISKDNLQTHLVKEHSKHLMHKNSKCETCGMRLARMELIEHVKVHPSHICPHCQLSYPEKDNLRQHISVHHATKVHVGEQQEDVDQQQHLLKCFMCQASFTRNDERTQHMEEFHMCQIEQDTRITDNNEMQMENVNLNSTEQLSQISKQLKNDRKKFRCRVCHEIVISRLTYVEHLKDKHMAASQTSEILKELSESSNNERRNELNKSNDSFGST